MRKLLVLFFVFFSSYFSFAQDKLLVIEGTSPNLYLNHTVASKENYYSIGRLYNVSPKELAPYNNLTFEKGLSLGQTIKIPLTANNFLQTESLKNNEALVPIYHLMQAREGLYRASVNYNKVPLDVLKKWNNLSGDAVGANTKLIIGFLKISKDQSPLVSQAIKISPSGVTEKPVAIVDKPVKKVKAETNIEKEQPKKEEENKVSSIPNQPNPVIEKTEEINTIGGTKTVINFNGGKFKNVYFDQIKNKTSVYESGAGATFKTTSGWQDGKYYCFHNTAEPGTIIKITNNINGKSIYAKVLDAIPDIKQNTGLLLRLSNSGATELGVLDNKFDCSITYAK